MESIRDVAGELDLVCLMSVNPGFGGQSFIERTYAKTRALRALLDEEGASDVLIEIDGGVGMGNARKRLVDAGANVLVAGSSVFKAADPLKAASDLANALNPSMRSGLEGVVSTVGPCGEPGVTGRVWPTPKAGFGIGGSMPCMPVHRVQGAWMQDTKERRVEFTARG